jgi:hypothetical protein
LAEGKAALPAVWRTLADGTPQERRVAAALLGWFRDARSIRPILAALDSAPGALTREQLLFDLNMILLTEAPEAEREDRNALAALHLKWLYGQLTTPSIQSDIRKAVLSRKTIYVYPDRITAPFSVGFGAATALLSSSSEGFLEAVRKTECGVAFHAITAANGVARVATAVYLPQGRILDQVWISLYRRDGDRWLPLRVPSHPVPRLWQSEPNLQPTVNRNYGSDHPLKILRLDLAMERIRVDLGASQFLQHENEEIPWTSGEMDARYVPLLERYRHSDRPSVKYTAESEWTRLTGRPNLSLWIVALSKYVGTPIQQLAHSVVRQHVGPLFADAPELAGAARDELVAAARTPEPVDRLKTRLPKFENVISVKQWTRFGLVDVAYGSEPRGQGGYSMLFERRDDRWIFVTLLSSWIS